MYSPNIETSKGRLGACERQDQIGYIRIRGVCNIFHGWIGGSSRMGVIDSHQLFPSFADQMEYLLDLS